MRKFLLTLFAVLTASVAFAGDGTKGNPYTVADLQAMDANALTDEAAWVQAYIVGSANNKLENFVNGTDGAVASNLMLADAQAESDYTKCVPLQLASKSQARTDLNLIDNPGNFGKVLLVSGTISKYFSVVGIKNVAEYELSGEGVTPTPTPQGDDFEAPLTDAKGNWEFEDVVLPEDLTYIWQQTSNYGMKATAYANSTKYVSDSYLVSPAIVLKENSVLTFEHVQRYGAEDPSTQLTLWVRENGATNWAAQLTIPSYSDGTNWNFVSSGDIDLSAYAGKTIQLGFRYTSSEDFAATWEIKNVKVTNAKAAEEGPTLKDPTNTPDKAYTIAQAIDIINNKDQYDMSKEVYTKGIIQAIKSIDVEKYERAQYWIVDQMGGDSIQVYNGYYLEGKAFTANDQIKVGDEVVVFGKLTLYKTTYEIDANNYIYSLNGKTTDEENPEPPTPEVQTVSVAKALEVIEALEAGAKTSDEYTVKGFVVRTPDFQRKADGTLYGNVNLTIADEKGGTATLTVFRGKSFDGENFTEETIAAIKEGDEVVFQGLLQKYVKDEVVTPELVSGKLISVNGNGSGVDQIVNGKSSNGAIYDLSGRRVEKALKGIYIVNGKKVVF